MAKEYHIQVVFIEKKTSNFYDKNYWLIIYIQFIIVMYEVAMEIKLVTNALFFN